MPFHALTHAALAASLYLSMLAMQQVAADEHTSGALTRVVLTIVPQAGGRDATEQCAHHRLRQAGSDYTPLADCKYMLNFLLVSVFAD
jgi:hypothetical protein